MAKEFDLKKRGKNRNKPCPYGSGKKFKKCCWDKIDKEPSPGPAWLRSEQPPKAIDRGGSDTVLAGGNWGRGSKDDIIEQLKKMIYESGEYPCVIPEGDNRVEVHSICRHGVCRSGNAAGPVHFGKVNGPWDSNESWDGDFCHVCDAPSCPDCGEIHVPICPKCHARVEIELSEEEAIEAFKEDRDVFREGKCRECGSGLFTSEYEGIDQGGFYTDDGTMVDTYTIPTPSICFSCSRYKDNEKDCKLTRMDQTDEIQKGEVFCCFAFDPVDLKIDKESILEDMTTYLEEKNKQEWSKEDSWVELGEQGKRIFNVIKDVEENNIMCFLDSWVKYLENNLVFPFEAKVIGHMDKGPLRAGDGVRVHRISDTDDLYGIIVELRRGRKKFDHPIDDLEILDKDSPNVQVLNDYSVWFANR